MLCESLAWRRHHNIDNIREIWQPPEPLLSYYSGGWHNKDKGENLVVTKNSLDERLCGYSKFSPNSLVSNTDLTRLYTFIANLQQQNSYGQSNDLSC